MIGFHGQTIFHNPNEKITNQLGDGKLLSQIVKKKVIYDFRQADIQNNGQGAPLTPIFHHILSKKIYKNFDIKFPRVAQDMARYGKMITNSKKLKDNNCVAARVT